MAGIETYALLSPNQLKRMQAREKYFGNLNEKRIIDNDLKIEPLLNSNIDPVTKRRIYSDLLNNIENYREKSEPNSSATTIDVPQTDIPETDSTYRSQIEQVCYVLIFFYCTFQV